MGLPLYLFAPLADFVDRLVGIEVTVKVFDTDLNVPPRWFA